jgi:hypothetical protein
MMTTMTAKRRAAHPRTHTRATAKNEHLQALLAELAAWLMLTGFAVACFLVFALAIEV